VKGLIVTRTAAMVMGSSLVLLGSLTLFTYTSTQHVVANRDLLLAITRRDPVALQDALRRGADPNARRLGKHESGNVIEYLKLLFTTGVQASSCESALSSAIPKEPPYREDAANIRIITLLLERGGDPDARDERGMTALMWATRTRSEKIVRLLLTHGCQVEAKDLDGRTAIWFAANAGSIPIVNALLEKRADINVAGINSGSPLMGAVWAGQPKMVAHLLKRGADTSTRVSARNLTALTIAQRSPVHLRRQIVPLLKQAETRP
jgi:hypothetical protein